MANPEKLIPFILKWETSVVKNSSETMEQFFERCKKKGWANDPLDRGGATNCGLTLTAYQAYCAKHGISKPTADNLKNIEYQMWLKIFKESYWDKMNGDKIVCQSIANILVDFAWASGSVTATKKLQALLGVTADGIFGMKTLASLNGKSALPLFTQIKNMRINYVNAIVRNNPSQKKWLNGWTRRINDIKWVG